MSDPLTLEETSKYTSIIDTILQTADLETVTRKKIRSGLEEKLGGKDLSSQKYAIKDLIEARFDALTQTPSASASPPPQNDMDVDTTPAKPKQHRPSAADMSLLDADAKLAAELQAQENRLGRARTTRGGSNGTTKTGKIVKKKATPRKKSAKKVGEDDNEADATPKKSNGFQKPFNLSEQLAVLVGEPQMSRPQVVKKIWEHIKANELQDPSDKRQIRCDDRMQAVFKQASINMFQMNKHLGSHLYPVDEE